MNTHHICCLTLVASLAAQAAPHPIANSTNSQLHASLEISLFASEPDVVDPVALTFDESGRMYVVEMRDYPYGFGPQRKPGGSVRLLEDTNHDSKADRSTLFAEDLSFPTSICPWNGGVLVTCPPEIIFLKDTNGDGRADIREVMFKGFTLGVTDSNANGLRWGLDNRVHGLNGGNGGRIVSLRKPGDPVPLADLDFSFDPQTGEFTTTYHSSRGFGLVFDDWGRSLVTYNINHIQQRFIPVRYLRRFPGFPALRATGSISEHEDMSRIFPISVAETRPNHPEQSGLFSSAGGMGYVGWEQYGPDLYGSVLVCDVVGNLVHRDVLEQQGPIFRATRASSEQNSEFFASRDNSFRPVGLELGPDGALYLLDMQREVIEHPDYIPESIRSKIDLRAGEDRGRIYRLKPKNASLDFINLASVPISALVENLSHPIQWRRTTAQRLIVERQLKDAIPSLKQIVASVASPLGRLHALWTLQGLNALDSSHVEHALKDANPGIRENALLLAEAFLLKSKTIAEQICTLANDPSARVRFQAALTLGQLKSAESRQALQSILLRDLEYSWTRVAVLSSVSSGAAELLSQLKLDVTERAKSKANQNAVTELADLATGRDGMIGFAAVLRVITGPAWNEPLQLAALKGLQTGLSRRTGSAQANTETRTLLEQLTRSSSSALMAASWRLARTLGIAESEGQREALEQAMRRARDFSIPEQERIAHVGLLALGNFTSVKDTLFALLDGNQPVAIQQAVLVVLREFNNTEVAKTLVGHWRTFAPPVRAAALALLLQRPSFHIFLLDALEKGQITVGELNLDLEQRRRLLWFSSPDIKTRAARLIGDGEYSNRKNLVDEWLAKLPAKGNAVAGKSVFELRCAQCHFASGTGHRVGPELTGMSHRSVEDLLSNILDPNMAINPAYITYNCETASGELETGLLQAESAEAVTLLQAAEKKMVLPRSNIRKLQSSGLSLMPEGLETGLTPENIRDLISFLQESH
jgi:putative membrane-bound dehydrogenase-like protein